MTDREIMQQALDALETADESAFWLKQESIVKVLRERLAQPAPPECQTEEEKAAFAFGWWKAMEVQRLAQPEQEPVAYAVYHRMGGGKSLHWPEQHSPDGDANAYQLAPLYTTPPQRKPLSDEEIKNTWVAYRAALPRYLCFARAIEAAHGIGEKPDAA